VRAPTFVADAAVRGATGLGGSAAALGGVAGAGWLPTRTIALRGVFGARIGSAADARVTTIAAGAGVAWQPLAWGSARAGFRVDALVLHDDVARDDPSGGAPVHRTRWVPGAGVFAEGEWGLGSTASLTLALGPEVAFGAAHVYVADRRVATLPPLRGVADLGVRLRF
jgi:hypothetical protein